MAEATDPGAGCSFKIWRMPVVSRQTLHGFCNWNRRAGVQSSCGSCGLHRTTLLNRLHVSQRQIDCLDYLIYQMDRG